MAEAPLALQSLSPQTAVVPTYTAAVSAGHIAYDPTGARVWRDAGFLAHAKNTSGSPATITFTNRFRTGTDALGQPTYSTTLYGTLTVPASGDALFGPVLYVSDGCLIAYSATTGVSLALLDPLTVMRFP